jgi:small multidrug resistance family-3 protein
VIVLKSTTLFVLAALLEIGGRGSSGKACENIAAGCGLAPGLSRWAPMVSSPPSNRTPTSDECWPHTAESSSPDRWDVAGAVVSLLGVGLIMYGPR